MAMVDVLPSAPPKTEVQNLYPTLPQDFRLQKINEIDTTLNHEVRHYRLVAKKYKKAQTVANWAAAGSGFLSTLFSSASLGSALTGIGIIASVPLGGVAGFFGLTSAAMIGASKKLESKISKHQEIVTLAVAKRDTVNRLLSRALKDDKISDIEYGIILDELTLYNTLKESVRSKLTRKPSGKKAEPQPDIEKIKKQALDEAREELKKRLTADSKPDLRK